MLHSSWIAFYTGLGTRKKDGALQAMCMKILHDLADFRHEIDSLACVDHFCLSEDKFGLYLSVTI